MTSLFTILFRPGSTTLRLKSRPQWVWTFLALAMLTACAALLSRGQWIDQTVLHLPSTADADAREAAKQFLEENFLRRVFFLPFRMVVGWGLFALTLFGSARALLPDRSTRYVHFLSLEVHAESAITLGLLLSAAGIELPSLLLANTSITDPVLRSLLASINLTTLWYVGVLTAGISVLSTCSKRTAFLITAGSWGLAQAINLGILNLLSQRFRFTF